MSRILFIVILSTLAYPAAADEIPLRKPGLWELKTTVAGGGQPVPPMQHCVDAQTDRLLGATGEPGTLAKTMCSKYDVQRSGGTVTIDSVCKTQMGTTTQRTVMTGSFDSGYTAKMIANADQGPDSTGKPRVTRFDFTVEAKWLGACKADQKPGDVILGPGMKVNVYDVPGAAPPRR